MLRIENLNVLISLSCAAMPLRLYIFYSMGFTGTGIEHVVFDIHDHFQGMSISPGLHLRLEHLKERHDQFVSCNLVSVLISINL